MDQNYENNIRNKIEQINKWRDSPKYEILCDNIIFRANDLIQKAEHHICSRVFTLNERVARTEIGSKSDLPRGHYCPTLVYDTVVGNVHRGKLLKRLSSKSKNYYIYSFDSDDRLIKCEQFYNGRLAYTEHIFYDEESVFGISLDSMGGLHHISVETYNDNRIVCYEKIQVLPSSKGNRLTFIQQEEYIFKSTDLHICYFHEFYPQQHIYRKNRFTFDFENGSMKGYWSEEVIGENDEVVLSSNYCVLTANSISTG